MSGSCISWAVCKSAPRSRQIITPAPQHSFFYRPDALPATQPAASNTLRDTQKCCGGVVCCCNTADTSWRHGTARTGSAQHCIRGAGLSARRPGGRPQAPTALADATWSASRTRCAEWSASFCRVFVCKCAASMRGTDTRTHARTHIRLMALWPGLPGWAGTGKVKPIWILLKQETMSGSGISWAICKSAPRSGQITVPAPQHSFFTGRMPFLPPNQQRQRTEYLPPNWTALVAVCTAGTL